MKTKEFSLSLGALGFAWLLVVTASVRAQDDGDREVFCENSPACAGSSLLVFFPESGTSSYRAPLVAGREIDVKIVLDTTDEGIHGWSYGLAHDDEILEIDAEECPGDDAFLCETDALALRREPWFNVSAPVARSEDAPAGFVSAVVLTFLESVALPSSRRNSLARLSYRVRAVPARSIRLEFVDEVLGNGGPPVKIVLSVSEPEGTTISRRPAELVHGIIEDTAVPEEGPELCSDEIDNDGDGLVDCDDESCEDSCDPSPPRFIRGDTDASGRLSVTDAVLILHSLFAGTVPPFACPDASDTDDDGSRTLTDGIYLLDYLFRQGRLLPPPFPDCGVDETDSDPLDCARTHELCEA